MAMAARGFRFDRELQNFSSFEFEFDCDREFRNDIASMIVNFEDPKA